MKREKKITKKELPADAGKKLKAASPTWKKTRREELKGIMQLFKGLCKDVKELKKTKDPQFKEDLIKNLENIALVIQTSFERLFDDETISTGFFAKHLKNMDKELNKAFDEINERVRLIENFSIMKEMADKAKRGHPMTEEESRKHAKFFNRDFDQNNINLLRSYGLIKPQEGLRH